MSDRFLIVGCGYIGERVADLLHEAGHTVLGLTHRAESAQALSDSKPWPAAACDISHADAVGQLAGHGDFQVIIHCASSSKGGAETYRAVYLDGLRHLMQTFPQARPLFVSSTSVYTQMDGGMVTEDSASLPKRDTGMILREAEDLALSHGGSVARLAGIYGPDRSVLLKNVLANKAVIEGGEGEGRVVNQIHREDGASAVTFLAQRLLAETGSVFNVVDNEPMTQRTILTAISAMFNAPMAPVGEPNHERKRPYSSKAVSNAKLRALGWQPQFPSYLDALTADPMLASSILGQLIAEGYPIPRSPNIIVIGLMGCGKSTVGRLVAQKIGFQIVDTDQVITDTAHQSIPAIFEREGEAGFRKRETTALLSLLGKRGHVIATGGGIVTQPQNLPLLRQLGFVVWLDANPRILASRTSSSRDRPLLQTENPEEKLRTLLGIRGPLYRQLADLRVQTDDLTPQETAYGIAESARIHFSGA
jgi:shikimate kinase/nucleoside-diphosphate-sugar epimerase